jgi:NAD(P)H-dependent FMN reductase
MSTPRILAFAGSSRRESFNKQLIKIAVAGAKSAGAEVTLIDLADYPLPLFNQDLEAEQGLPEKAVELKKLFLDSDGLLMSCPEYNSSISPLLKNAIDWASRPAAGEAPLACYVGKVAGLVSASPGALGGLRGLVTVRSILGNIRVLVVPEQVAVAKAAQAFDEQGGLVDARQRANVENVGAAVARLLVRLGS